MCSLSPATRLPPPDDEQPAVFGNADITTKNFELQAAETNLPPTATDLTFFAGNPASGGFSFIASDPNTESPNNVLYFVPIGGATGYVPTTASLPLGTVTVTVAEQATKVEGILQIRDDGAPEPTGLTADVLYLGLGTSGDDTFSAGTLASPLRAGLWGFGGNDTFTGSNQNDWMVGGTGADRFLLGASSGSDVIYLGNDSTIRNDQVDGTGTTNADTVRWNYTGLSVAATGQASQTKVIYGFEAGATANGTGFYDVINFAVGELRNANGSTVIAGGTGIVSNNITDFSAAENLTSGGNKSRLVFFEYGVGSTATGELDITEVGQLLTNGITGLSSIANQLNGVTVNSSQRLIFSLDDGTDSYLFFFDGSVGSNATRVEASELTWLGVVKDVNNFAADDFLLS